MNKQKLIDAVSADTQYSKCVVGAIINSAFGNIKSSLYRGESARFVGFGSFVVKKRKARNGTNPNDGKAIKIKAQKKVGFRPSTAWIVK